MKLVSTRSSNIQVSSAEAIVSGLSAGGGLFAPSALPEFSLADISALSEKSYSQLTAAVAAPFLSDFTEEELNSLCALAYKNFPSKVAPLVSLDDKTHVLELFHGPTLAFKDFALQLLPYLLSASLKKLGINKTAVILAATSGDTGSAALEGFSSVPGTKVCVFYPESGVSAIQRLQMTTQAGENTKVIGIKGNFDDAQSAVKKIFTEIKENENLSNSDYLFTSANSINWGRIVPQIAYYFSAYTSLIGSGKIKLGDSVNVAVPTGNFGNILAAYYAKKSGLPMNKLICASNANNVLTDFINTGIYNKNREFYATISPSMDILISSNLERFLFELTDKNANAVKEFMSSLADTGCYEIDGSAKCLMSKLFHAGFANDSETEYTINKIWKEHGYLCDTHTAVGLKVYEDYVSKTQDNTPTLIASTASPFKFADNVLKALGETAYGDDFEKLSKLSKVSIMNVPTILASLEKKEENHKIICEPEQMKTHVFDWLNIKNKKI